MGAKDKKEKGDKKGDKKNEKTSGLETLEPPSGTRDFFPAQMKHQRWLFDRFREVAALFGFQEYDAPVLEREELYKRKAGEEITQQMYNFADKDGDLVTLRPEMTPSLARMVMKLMRSETGEMSALMPLKWFSIPQCWRFETVQQGRKREHYQWNMDIVGVTTIAAEVELLSAIVTFFEKIGITSKEVGIKVNSRKVLGAVLKNAGVPDERFAETCVIVDKQDKKPIEEIWQELNQNVGLSMEVAKRITDATTASSLDEFAELAGIGESAEVKEMRKLFELADDYGFGDWLRFDASVVRGLAYYTGVVFEGFDRTGQLRAIFGGGRYDKLMTLYGAPKEVPCVGFGFGDCVVALLLETYGLTPTLPSDVDYLVAAFNDDMSGKALNVARRLRQAGFRVDVFSEPAKKVGKAFNYADRVGAIRIAFVAPGEWEQGMVRIKDLRNFSKDAKDDEKQKDVPLDQLAHVDRYFGITLDGKPYGQSATAPVPAPATGASSAAITKDQATVEKATKPGCEEQFLQKHPYIGGFSPSRADKEFFERLQKTGRPETPAMARWYNHMESFTPCARLSWC